MDPSNPPRFRPPDRRSRQARSTPGERAADQVDTFVAECLSESVPGLSAGGGVEVAVLDTWPLPLARSGRKLGLIGGGRNHIAPGVNPVLDLADAGGLVPKSRIHNHVDQAQGDLWCQQSDCGGGFEPVYEMADHGLFVADVLADIAPNADLHVYRVLNDWGSGDLFAVWNAVWDALRRRDPDRPLILNLSLGFAPQLLHLAALFDRPDVFFQHPQRWSRGVADAPYMALLDPDVAGHAAGGSALFAPGAAQRDLATEAATLRKQGLVDPQSNRLRGVLQAIDHLFGFDPTEDRVLVVAAAGNDSCTHSDRLPPRVPALIEGVLGVSAGEGENYASFSNFDDSWTPDDGVKAYGGEVNAGETVEGLVGLYVSDRIPSNRVPAGAPNQIIQQQGDANDAGWAVWAGTSFATPIVAGLAACIWSERPDMSAQDVLNAIVFDENGVPRPSIPLKQQVF